MISSMARSNSFSSIRTRFSGLVLRLPPVNESSLRLTGYMFIIGVTAISFDSSNGFVVFCDVIDFASRAANMALYCGVSVRGKQSAISVTSPSNLNASGVGCGRVGLAAVFAFAIASCVALGGTDAPKTSIVDFGFGWKENSLGSGVVVVILKAVVEAVGTTNFIRRAVPGFGFFSTRMCATGLPRYMLCAWFDFANMGLAAAIVLLRLASSHWS